LLERRSIHNIDWLLAFSVLALASVPAYDPSLFSTGSISNHRRGHCIRKIHREKSYINVFKCFHLRCIFSISC